MNAFELPKSLPVGGKDMPIRSDFRAILDILIAHNDPELDSEEAAAVMLTILYPDYAEIPMEHRVEALEQACSFIDCGRTSDGRRRPRLVDWEQDARLIIPAVNNVAHREIREMEYLHWWTFLGWFMEIGDSTFSTVLRLRSKKAAGEKLDKAEEKYYRENKSMVDIKQPMHPEETAEMENIMKWL